MRQPVDISQLMYLTTLLVVEEAMDTMPVVAGMETMGVASDLDFFSKTQIYLLLMLGGLKFS